MSFTDIITGHQTLATDVNQLVDALNGTAAGQVNMLAANNTTLPFTAVLPSLPAGDQQIVFAGTSGDIAGGYPRAALYVRGSDGYGGVELGNGTAAGDLKLFNSKGATGRIGTATTGWLYAYGDLGSTALEIGATSSGWAYINSQQANANGTRFQVSGSTVAHFAGPAFSSTGLVVNTNFVYGVGGADDAELEWTEDLSLAAGEVVCWGDDAGDDGRGGLLARCTHSDCAGAGVISTRPASMKGGASKLVPETVQRPDGARETVWEPMPDDDPHWKPLALEGKVPIRVLGDPQSAAYRPGTPLVSAGDRAPGRARPQQPGERWVLGVVVSRKSDVAGRALAPGCVLMQVRL